MFKKIGVIALILLLVTSLAAAASEDKTNIAKPGGYTVTPAQSTGGDIGILWIHDTITQGETNLHSKIVNSNNGVKCRSKLGRQNGLTETDDTHCRRLCAGSVL